MKLFNLNIYVVHSLIVYLTIHEYTDICSTYYVHNHTIM